MAALWDEPLKEPRGERNSVQLRSYVVDSYTESYEIAEDEHALKVIDEKKGGETKQIATVLNGQVTLNEEEEGERHEDDDSGDYEGAAGLTYTARIVMDGYFDKKHCLENGELKGRRPMPQAFASDFFSKVSQNKEGKWVYSGELNGWPALTSLEVIRMDYVFQTKGGVYSKSYWKASKHGKKGEKPYYPQAGLAFFLETPRSIQVQVREPSWSSIGFSKQSPGFVFWYSKGLGGQPRVAHGENCVAAAREGGQRNLCVRAHHFSHRYAVGERRETFKETLSYHTAVLLEWNHGKYCTVVELAWLAGLGGYGGKSNWFDDKDSPNPALFDAMPGCLKKPWRSSMSEIRVFDVEAKNLDEFKAYLKKYEGKRFLKPEINHSGPVRLSFREEEHILRYCLNYIQRDTLYSEATRNCQTFAADLIGFLLAKNISPHNSPMVYYDRRHLFLYEPDMFETDKPGRRDKLKALISPKKSPVEKEKEEKRESLTHKAKRTLFGSKQY